MPVENENIVPPGANIKVIGVGGGGGNAVNTMIKSNLEGVQFIAANTDVQSLRFALSERKIQLGKELTKGLGAGADPDVGRDAALEDRHEIQEMLTGADMVFITAGMGGGTGTGGASVVSQIARELGALTVGVVTKPFNFEGKRRLRHAELGIERLRESVDTLITIPNQRLLQIATPDLSMVDAFRMADEVLVNAVKGISDIINIPGTVNVDFADVKAVMSSMGMALMGIGRASGENRAIEAAKQAISSPLLEDIDIEGATGLLINISAGTNISLMEVNEACSVIQDAAHEDANIIFGAVIEENIGDEIRVTVIATGFPADFEEIKGDSSAQRAFEGATVEKKQRPIITTPPQQIKRNYIVTPKPPEPAPVSAPQQTASIGVPTVSANIPSAPVEPEEPAYSEAEDLTRMTFDSVENREEHAEPPPPAAEENEETVFAAVEEEAPVQVEEEVPEKPAATAAPVVETSSETPIETEPPLESMFNQVEESVKSSFDKKIDEALELAERIKKQNQEKKDEDDLDVPAFLRNPGPDITLE